MHELQKRFQKFIQKNQLVQNGEKVLLAVSGGMDSMVMLDLFGNSIYSAVVAHCNFGLRGDESDGDEQFVISEAERYKIQIFTKKIEITGNSIQLEAREKRYQWFHELAGEKGFDRIATAHHLDDSLETTLLNLTRGTGISGLAGIPVQNELIIRPLLFATREELSDYAMGSGLRWREDSSNTKPDYTRNKIRLAVIPQLKEINPSLNETFHNTKERLDLANSLILNHVKSVMDEYYSPESRQLGLHWIKYDHDLLILHEILSRYGFNYVTVKQVFTSIGKSGSVFEANDWKIFMDREALFFQPKEGNPFEEVVINELGIYETGSFKLEIGLIPKDGKWKLAAKRDNYIAFFDSSKLQFPFKVRQWKYGDTFRPLGMKGRKKVSDLLIDLKVPLAKKSEVLVLESSGGIAWVVGYRIAEKFKLDEKSKEVYKFTFTGIK